MTSTLLHRIIQTTRETLAVRRYWLAATGGTVVYLLLFLAAIRDLTISPGGIRRFVEPPAVEVVADWPSRWYQQQAPFFFEPVAAIYPTDWAEILISPLNIATGLVLGGLVGLNIAVAWYLTARVRACRRPGIGRARTFGGLLGALPGFFVGMACCTPALAIVLGAQFTVLLTAVRSWFIPVVLVVLVATLVWNVHRSQRLRPEADGTGEALTFFDEPST